MGIATVLLILATSDIAWLSRRGGRCCRRAAEMRLCGAVALAFRSGMERHPDCKDAATNVTEPATNVTEPAANMN